MKSIAKKAAGLSVVAALLVPAGASAVPPAHSKASPKAHSKSAPAPVAPTEDAPPAQKKAKTKSAPPAHAKAYGRRCKGQSKVKDPITKTSPFKACVKAKGVVTPPVVVDPVVDPVDPVVDPTA